MRTCKLISATLLLVQALGLQHLAFSSHAYADGVAYEHAALAADSHADERGHVCADAGVVNEEPESCAVVASWLTASRPAAGRAALAAFELDAARRSVARSASPPLAPLSLAPKSSPPAPRQLG